MQMMQTFDSTLTLQTIFQTCTTFQLYSSLKLNLDKSEKHAALVQKGKRKKLQ